MDSLIIPKCYNCYYYQDYICINGEGKFHYCTYHQNEFRYAENLKPCTDFIHYEVVEESMLEAWEK